MPKTTKTTQALRSEVLGAFQRLLPQDPWTRREWAEFDRFQSLVDALEWRARTDGRNALRQDLKNLFEEEG